MLKDFRQCCPHHPEMTGLVAKFLKSPLLHDYIQHFRRLQTTQAHTNLKTQHKFAIPTIFTNFLTKKLQFSSQLTKILEHCMYGNTKYIHLSKNVLRHTKIKLFALTQFYFSFYCAFANLHCSVKDVVPNFCLPGPYNSNVVIME